MVFPLRYTPPVAPRDSSRDPALGILAPHGGRGATQPRGNAGCWARGEEEEGLSSPGWEVQHGVAKVIPSAIMGGHGSDGPKFPRSECPKQEYAIPQLKGLFPVKTSVWEERLPAPPQLRSRFLDPSIRQCRERLGPTQGMR